MLYQTKIIYRPGSGKSIAHEQIQYHLKKHVPSLQLEKTIGPRRADGVWEDKKIVFEIQLSPISRVEVIDRIADYAAHGYQVVWILHDTLFNQSRVSPAERYLRQSYPTYFTDGNVFYDQMEVIAREQRSYRGDRLLIDPTLPFTPFIPLPIRQWSLHFTGDLHTYCAMHGTKVVDEWLCRYSAPTGWRWWVQFIGARILECVSIHPK